MHTVHASMIHIALDLDYRLTMPCCVILSRSTFFRTKVKNIFTYLQCGVKVIIPYFEFLHFIFNDDTITKLSNVSSSLDLAFQTVWLHCQTPTLIPACQAGKQFVKECRTLNTFGLKIRDIGGRLGYIIT